jgi:hypothetical protein
VRQAGQSFAVVSEVEAVVEAGRGKKQTGSSARRLR